MTRKNVITVVMAAMVVMSLASFAFAYGHGQRGAGFMANLTEEQRAKATEIFNRHGERVQPISDKLYAKTLELDALLAADPMDSKKIDAVGKEVNALQQKMFEEKIQLRKELAEAGIKRFGRGGCGKGRGMKGNCPGMGAGCPGQQNAQ